MPKPNNARDRARLREEARAENARRRGRRKGGSKILLYIMLGVLLVGTLVTLSFTVLFKIETVEVTGDAPYDTQTILDTAGIQPGQNLLALSGKKINERLTAALPYIGQAKLHRSLPSKLVLEVQRAEVARAYLLEDGYAWCDASDKVLEKSTLRPEQGLVVQCQSITAGQAGQAIVFADSTEKELLFFILGQMELEGLTQDITRLEL